MLRLIRPKFPLCVVLTIVVIGGCLAPGVWPGDGCILRSIGAYLTGPFCRFFMYEPGNPARELFCLRDIAIVHCMVFINVWYFMARQRDSLCYCLLAGCFVLTWFFWLLYGLGYLAYAR